MNLIDLANGSTSLEFSSEERADVLHRLESIGRVRSTDETTYTSISVDGIDLIYLDEWDAPCLIASTKAGTDLLQRVLHWIEPTRRVTA